MTFLRKLLAFSMLFAGAGAALGANAISAHYSFMDVYRLAVTGNAAGGAAQDPLGFGLATAGQHAQAQAQRVAQFPAPFPDYQMRAASSSWTQGAVPVFSIAAPGLASAGFAYSSAAVPAPSRWLLILSGLALAAWVARRRLGYSL